MSDTADYGGGLAANIVGGDAQPSADVPQAAAPSFGSRVTSFLGGPQYRAPDPEKQALDQSADMLEQRIKRANSIATNPLLQFFNPEGVAKARDFVPGATNELQTLKAKQQAQTDIQKQATNFGLPKALINPNITDSTIDNYLLEQYKSGDFTAANALKARGKGEWVTDFAGAAVDGAGQRLKAADTASTKLTAAGNNQQAYAAARRSLTPEDTQALSAMGITSIPEKATEWQGTVQQHGAKFAQAQQLHAQVTQKLNNMTNFDGTVPKEVQEASQGDVPLGSSNEPAGFPVRVRAADGQTGHIGPNGSVRVDKYGKPSKDGGWTAWDPKREEAFQKYTADPDTKGAINQYNIANKFRHEAMDENSYTSSSGLALLKDTLGGVGRDVAETSAAAGSIGLTKMWTQQQGSFESWANRAKNEVGAFEDWLSSGGKKGKRLSQQTIDGLKLVAEGNYQYARDQAKERLRGAVTYAGRGGKPLDELPLDPALRNEMADVHEEARRDAINGFLTRPSLVRGSQRVFFPQGANVNGATPPREPMPSLDQERASLTQVGTLPPGTVRAPPGGGTLPAGSGAAAAPVSPAGVAPPGGSGAPSPAGPSSAPTGGGGVTIAGQPVSVPLPPGASPNFVPALQRIESGNEKSPWTATAGNGPSGKPLSSASGAFQMIDSTWNDNKPAGAPARAKDATPAQQSQAFANLIAKNAGSLSANRLPVNDTTLYVAHNLGAGGAITLLQANPDADARTTVGETAAKNNPTFFKGRPTVATVLQRYKAEMEKAPDDEGPKPKPGSGGATAQAPGLMHRVNSILMQGVPEGERDKAAADVGNAAVENAPAIGSVAGAIAGSAAGPGGTLAGGGAGGVAGNRFRNYMQGKPQDWKQDAKEGALGVVLGVAPEGRPIVGALARAAGATGVEAGAAAAEGGDSGDIVDATVKGAEYALGGEALGRFISAAGPTAHKVLSKFLPSVQKDISEAAGKLVEARKVLETEQPKLAGEGAGANPKYEAAKKAEEDATQVLKDHNQNPDDMAYAYEQTRDKTSAGEAATLRRANAEKAATSEGYNQLREDVAAAKPGEKNIKPNQAVPDGPVSTIRTPENPTGKVPEAFRADAEHAEMLVTAPAKDWGTKWQQLQDAGSELIKKRMNFLANNDKVSADAMDSIFQGVRNQQKAVAKRLFGDERGAEVISHLENLDKRYARVMNATAGMDYQKMRGIIQGGNTPARRELEANFKEFAKDDPSALRAFNAMKAGAQGRITEEAKLMLPVIAGEFSANMAGVPSVGLISAAVGGHRLYKVMQQYMNAKVLGRPVTFKDFLNAELKRTGGLNAAGSAAQRAVVQSGGPSISLNPIGSANANELPQLMGGDGRSFADKRGPQDDRETRLKPFYDAVPDLAKKFSSKPMEQWSPAELSRFHRTPGFIAAARKTLGPSTGN